jgi:hypothetical protein
MDENIKQWLVNTAKSVAIMLAVMFVISIRSL